MGEKKNKKIIRISMVGMGQRRLNQVYGEAASQIIQGYKGIRVNKFGNEIIHKGRNLKKISNYKINLDYEEINLKQQAGFSAELIEEARKNKEAILTGKATRVRTTDGLGQTNNTQYDHVIVDETGNIIEGSGTQMKFLKVKIDKKTGEKNYNVIDKLAKEKSWERYNTKVTIPKEDYEGALQYTEKQYKKNIKLYEKALEKGKIEAAKKYKKIAEDYKNIKERIAPAELTQKEALDVRKNPENFVVKEVIKDIHSAGVNAAKGVLIVGGSISLAQNLFSVIKEEKDLEEAFKDVVVTVTKTGVTAYMAGSGGTALKTVMHSSKNQLLRRMGTTSIPTLLVTGTLEVSASMKKYIIGEIDELQLLEELGEKGVGMVTAGYCAGSGAVIGATLGSVVPIVGTAVGGVVGGFVGSILGYNISSILYKEAMEALKSERISYERRIIIEEMAQQAIEENRKYREMFVEFSEKKLADRGNQIQSMLLKMEKSIIDNEIDEYMVIVNKMGEIFGCDLKFKNMEEFDSFMSDENSILTL